MEILNVERVHGKAVNMRLREGDYEMVFVLIKNKVEMINFCKYGAQRMEGGRLWIPPAIYKEAFRRAYGILKPAGGSDEQKGKKNKRKKNKKRMGK